MVAHEEGLEGVALVHHDLHERLPFAADQFDAVVATVALQFLRPQRTDSLLSELSEATTAGFPASARLVLTGDSC